MTHPGLLRHLPQAPLFDRAHSHRGTPGESMARVARAITLVGASLAVASVAIDGIALKALAGSRAAAQAGEAGTLLQDFVTARSVNTALWGTAILVFFGLAVVAHGLAARLSGWLPGWIAWAALVSGAGSVVAAALRITSGEEIQASELLVTGTASLLAVWALALGYRWWRGPRTRSSGLRPTSWPSRATPTGPPPA